MWELIAGKRCEAVECAVLSMSKGERRLASRDCAISSLEMRFFNGILPGIIQG